MARLSALWRHGQEPDLRAFLAGAGRLSAAELTDVLCTDQRQRWLHGQRPEVEAYIALHGSFHPGAEPAIDLVFGEFLARRELGESPTLDEYCRRFPELAGQLRLHVGLYDALGEVGPARDDPASGPGEDPSTASHAAQTPAVAGGRPGAAAPRGPEAGAFESDYESFKRLLHGNGPGAVGGRTSAADRAAPGRAPPRRPGTDLAGSAGRPVCHLSRAPECPDQTTCLHLVASAGRPLHEEGDWSRLDGRNRRVPLGVRKVGLIAARGQPIEVANLEPDAPWLASPEWAGREGIRGFGGHPLIDGGQVVGVLAVFFRTPMVGEVLMWLRLIADRAAAAVAAEGGGQRTEVGKQRAASLSLAFPFSARRLPGVAGLRNPGRGRPRRHGHRLQGAPAQLAAPGSHQGGPLRRSR